MIRSASRTILAVSSIALFAAIGGQDVRAEDAGHPAEHPAVESVAGMSFENCGRFALLTFGENGAATVTGAHGTVMDATFEGRAADQLALVHPLLGTELIDVLDDGKLKLTVKHPRGGFAFAHEEVVCPAS